jgi:hypothetical protein
MSLWEFLMTIEGWKLANGSGDSEEEGSAKPPTEAEFEDALARLID